jgi:hypothetical protein
LVVGLWASPSFPTDQTMFTTSLDLGVERSTDGGRTWTAIVDGLPTLQVPALAVSPSFTADHTLFAGCAEGLFRSDDSGESWTPAGAELQGTDVRIIALSASYPHDPTLFVVTGDNRLLRSIDDGATWQPTPKQIEKEEIVSVVCSPGFGEDRTLFIGTYSVDPKDGSGLAGIWRGDEAGNSLTIQTTYKTNNRWVAFGIPATFSGTGMFFVGIHNAVLRPMLPSVTSDGFSRKRLWKAEPVAPMTGSVVALAPSSGYADDRTLFAATSHGVYKSETGGLSWRSIDGGLRQKSIVAVVLSPEYPTDRQAFVLTLGGDVWRLVDR